MNTKPLFALLLVIICTPCGFCSEDKPRLSLVNQPLLLDDYIKILPVPVYVTNIFPISGVEAVAYPTAAAIDSNGGKGSDGNLISMIGIKLRCLQKGDDGYFEIIVDTRTAANKIASGITLIEVMDLLKVCLQMEVSPTLQYKMEIKVLATESNQAMLDRFNGPLWSSHK